MLDRKHVDAYNGIQSPDYMLDRIKANANISKKKRFDYKKLIPIAACILLMASILPTYIGLTNPEITLTQAATAARSLDIEIPVSVEIKRASSISVSSGSIGIDPDEKIKGSTQLIWSISPTDASPYILTVEDWITTREYSLSYNEKNDSWTITEN